MMNATFLFKLFLIAMCLYVIMNRLQVISARFLSDQAISLVYITTPTRML